MFQNGCCSLAVVSNKRAILWLYRPSTHGGGEENGKKKRQNLMGQDTGSLAGQ